jgi:hypothetical protein
VPVLCEGTSRMTRAASDCASEHEKNYFDSRLMSVIATLQQPSFQDVANSLAFTDLPASRNICAT